MVRPIPTQLVFTRGDCFPGDEQIMQPARAGKPNLISSFQDAGGLSQQLLGMFLGDELQEAFGTDAYPACEQALEMIFTEVDVFSDLAQVGWREAFFSR